MSQRFKIPQHIIIRHAGVHIALGILPNIRIHAGFANLHRGGKISGFWLPVGVPQLIALAMQRLHIQIIGKPIQVGVNHRGVARCANGVAKSNGVLNNGLFVAVVQDLLILQVISHRQHKILVLALHLSQHALNIIGLNRGLLGIVRIAVMVHAKGHARCLRRVHIIPKLRIQVVVAVAHTDHGKGLARILPCGVIHTFSVMLRHIGAKRRRRSGRPYREHGSAHQHQAQQSAKQRFTFLFHITPRLGCLFGLIITQRENKVNYRTLVLFTGDQAPYSLPPFCFLYTRMRT